MQNEMQIHFMSKIKFLSKIKLLPKFLSKIKFLPKFLVENEIPAENLNPRLWF